MPRSSKPAGFRPSINNTAEVVPGWPSVRATVVHIAGATDLWAPQFLGEPTAGLATEDELPRSTTSRESWPTPTTRSTAWSPAPRPSNWPLRSRTKNIRGQVVTAPLWAALRHVVNHATYHRGQIASKLGRLGVEAPVTDLVYWAVEEAESR